MLKNENEALDDYIIILLTKVTYGADAHINIHVSNIVAIDGKRVNNIYMVGKIFLYGVSFNMVCIQ